MENLIKKARRGDADAFVELMESQMKNMYKAVYSFLSNEDDVADAISDTILTCWEKLGQLREDRYFRTWMTRILINHCKDIYRKKQELVFYQEPPQVPCQETEYENLEWKEALQTLETRYRTVMILYYVEGFKTAEISKILEIPEATVRTRLARARERLAVEYNPMKRRKTV